MQNKTNHRGGVGGRSPPTSRGGLGGTLSFVSSFRICSQNSISSLARRVMDEKRSFSWNVYFAIFALLSPKSRLYTLHNSDNFFKACFDVFKWSVMILYCFGSCHLYFLRVSPTEIRFLTSVKFDFQGYKRVIWGFRNCTIAFKSSQLIVFDFSTTYSGTLSRKNNFYTSVIPIW